MRCRTATTISRLGGISALSAREPSAGKRSERLVIAGLVAAVVLLRAGLVLAVTAADPERSVVDDTPSYTDPARSILHDGDFDRSPDTTAPEFIRTPGYPAFVAVVYWVSDESDTAVVVVQAAGSGLSVLLAIVLARRLSGSLAVGLVAGVILALDPVQAAAAGYIASETVATVLVTLTAYCGVRFAQSSFSVPWGAAYGVTLAVATYVRPTTYYFAAAAVGLLVVMAARSSRDRTALIRGSIAFLVPCAALLGAWNVRNHHEVDSWRFNAVESKNLYWYRAADIVARRDGIDLEEARLRLTERLYRGRGPEFDYERYRNGDPPSVWEHRQGQYYGRAQQEGLEILRSEPQLVARQFVRGVYSQLVQSGWGDAFGYLTGQPPPGLIRAGGLLEVWGVEALALVGVALSLRRRGPERFAHVLTVALVAYMIVVSAGPEAAAGHRFRVPIWPILCIYAAIGLDGIVRVVRERRAGRLAA